VPPGDEIPQPVRDAVADIVRRLAGRDFEDARGSHDRDAAAALGRRLDEAGLELVPSPDEAWAKATVEREPPWIRVEIPLWTRSGESAHVLTAQLRDEPEAAYHWRHVLVAQRPHWDDAAPDDSVAIPPPVAAELREIATRLARGDVEGLARDGIYRGDVAGLTAALERYPVRLVAPPPEAFDEERMLAYGDGWRAEVDLWDDDGRSDLTLLADVREESGGYAVELYDVDVL
jgi:hypothetical protein